MNSSISKYMKESPFYQFTSQQENAQCTADIQVFFAKSKMLFQQER